MSASARTVAPARSEPRQRAALTGVALPSEHGGWGLTVEAGLLGLLVAPGWAGCCLALAAVVAFLVRTPLKLALVDRRRGRTLARTRLAWRVVIVEALALTALVVGAVVLADSPFWVPAVVAAPFALVEGWYDVRSRGRRLLPELAGAAAVSSVAAMIVLADDGAAALAAGVWTLLVARLVTSIPYVRSRVRLLHGGATPGWTGVVADAAAIAAAALAWRLDHALTAGAVAVLVIVAYQRLSARRPVPRAAVLGVRQLAMGIGLVVVTAVGVVAS